MSPQDHILNRLQRHVSQIARMVAPGSTRSQTIRNMWNFSPIVSNFGGRKFQRAAQTMRVLTRANPLEARAEKTNVMAHTIQAKFQNPQKLLHVSMAGSGFWSEVEQVFPNQVSTERTDTPLEAGELRQGSIIQQFNTVPKAGQSLESFKGQVQRSPVAPRRSSSPSSLPKKPSPKDKLFSRVQEITPGSSEKKSADKTKPIESQPDEPASIQRQIDKPVQTQPSDPDTETPPSSTNEATQQQPDPTLKPQLQGENTNTSLASAHTATEPQPKPVVSPTSPRPTTETASSITTRPIQRNVEQDLPPTSSSSDIQAKALDTTPKVRQSELTLARAIQKQDKTGKPTPPVAQPSNRSSTTPISSAEEKPKMATQPKAVLRSESPVVSSTPSSAEPVVQRSVITERSIQEPETQSGDNSPLENFSTTVNTPEPVATISASQMSMPAQPTASLPEMPLKNHIQRKQIAIATMRSSVSDPVRLRVAREPLKLATLPIQRATAAATKPGYFETLLQAAKPTKKIGSGKLSLSYPDLAAIQNAALAPVYAAKEKVSSSVNSAIDTVTAPVYAAKEKVSSSVNSAIETVTAPFQSAKKKLSKFLGQDEEPVATETAVVEPAQVSAVATPTPEPVSINDLAEKIFPLVKQLLELEMERTGSRFR